MSYKDFQKSLKIGQIYETKAQKQLIIYYKNKYNIAHTCDNNKYDFKMSNNKTYEVKADLTAHKTGFIFIEDTAFNKQSGITITKADYYIIIIIVSSGSIFTGITFNELYLKISVKRLKKLITKKKYFRYYEDSFKSGYLFEIATIKSKSKLI